VSVGVIQEPNIISQSFSGCVPFSLTLNEDNILDSLDYTWTVIGKTSMQSKQASPTFTFTEPDVYLIELVVKNSHGCADTATVSIDAGRTVFAGFDIVNENEIYINDLVQFINTTRGAS